MFMSDIARTAPHTAIAALQTGLTAGTLLETATGWRAVERLRTGDRVYSYDGGLVQIAALDRCWSGPQSEVLLIPGGAFDNCADLTLPADQHLLIDTLGDPDLPDTMTALIPAAALAGFRGTRRLIAEKPTELVTPLFAQAEAIYANSGTLLYCPAVAHGPGRLPQSGDFTRLDMADARALLRRLDQRTGLLHLAS